MPPNKGDRISPLVDLWLPHGTPPERVAAQRTLDDLIAICHQICERLDSEEMEPVRDISEGCGMVDGDNPNA